MNYIKYIYPTIILEKFIYWGQQLTNPSPNLTEPEERQKSQSLLGILVALIGGSGWVLLFQAVTSQYKDIGLTAFLVVSFVGLYLLAKQGYITIIAAVLVVLFFSLFVGASFTSSHLAYLSVYLAIPLFTTTLFFSGRWLIRLALLVTVIALASLLVSAWVQQTGVEWALIERLLLVMPLCGVAFVYFHYNRKQLETLTLVALKKTEKSLDEAQNRYYALFEQTHDAVFILDLQGRHLEANQRAANLLGYTIAEIQHLTTRDLSAELEKSEAVRHRLLEGEHIPPYERLFRKKDGTTIPVEVNVEVVYDRERKPKHIQSIVRDITARKKQEQQLSLQSAALGATAEAIMITDIDGMIQWGNPAYTRLTGYELAEVFGKNPRELVRSGKHDPSFYKAMWDTILAGEVWQGQLINRRKDGSLYTEQQTITSVKDEQGQITHFVTVKRDITNQEQRAMALRESEARYRSMFEDNVAVKLLIDPATGQILDANTAACEFYGYPFAELTTMQIQQINILSEAEVKAEMALALQQKRRFFQFQHRLANGEIRDVEVFSGPVIIQGKTHLYSIILDVTARRQAELALRQSEERLKMALEGTQAGTWEWLITNGGTIFNERWAEIIGYTLAELSPVSIQTWIDFTHPDDLQRSNQALARHFAGETAYYQCEVRMKHKNGQWVWVWDRGKVMEWSADGQPLRMFGTHVDITERKQAEEALAQSELRQRTLLRAIPDMVFRNHHDGTYLDYHAVNVNDLAVPPAQFMGRKIEQVLPTEVSDKFTTLIETVVRTSQEQTLEYSLMLNGQQVDYEARMVAAGEDEVLTIVRNITERKQAQLRQFELTLEKERTHLLTQFIQNAAHEFRTPLSIINSGTFLMVHSDSPEKREAKALAIEKQVGRITLLVDMLLEMAKLESLTSLAQNPLDLPSLIDNLCHDMRVQYGDEPALQLQLPPLKNLMILANRDELVGAFKQILMNAYSFTPPTGTIKVWLESTEDKINTLIEDTGAGIAPENLPHIFETFWRQDQAHSTSGLGLGLPIARKVIELHGGTIDVESHVGVGTVFKVCLPQYWGRESLP